MPHVDGLRFRSQFKGRIGGQIVLHRDADPLQQRVAQIRQEEPPADAQHQHDDDCSQRSEQAALSSAAGRLAPLVGIVGVVELFLIVERIILIAHGISFIVRRMPLGGAHAGRRRAAHRRLLRRHLGRFRRGHRLHRLALRRRLDVIGTAAAAARRGALLLAAVLIALAILIVQSENTPFLMFLPLKGHNHPSAITAFGGAHISILHLLYRRMRKYSTLFSQFVLISSNFNCGGGARSSRCGHSLE